jgi:hypothetical protein
MSVHATRFLRKMRGGAQAHLLQCDDGHSYVVKFRNNPQHRRVLVNEWVASALLNHLGISTPPTAIVNVSSECLQANPEISIELGSRRQLVEPGLHFGSRYPGNPGKVMVYDFLPDTLLEKVINANEFLGVLAFDKWVGNADARQSIFVRAHKRQLSSLGEHALGAGFEARMIDHSYVFDGPHWKLLDSPLQGLYFRPNVYQKVRGLEDFQPWLDRVLYFPDEVVNVAQKQIPPEWLADDATALEAMLEKLMSRRNRVPDLIADSVHARVNPFPEWKELRAVSRQIFAS